MSENALTDKIIGAAIEVHRHVGPVLLESAYEECLCWDFTQVGLSFVVEDRVIPELKAVDKVLPIHKTQSLTYLRASGKQVGLLINFKVVTLKDGIQRVVNNYSGPDVSSPRPLRVLSASAVK